MSTVNELRTQRAKSWEKANAFLIAHRDGKGILSAVDTATYEAMEQEIVKPRQKMTLWGVFMNLIFLLCGGKPQ